MKERLADIYKVHPTDPCKEPYYPVPVDVWEEIIKPFTTTKPGPKRICEVFEGITQGNTKTDWYWREKVGNKITAVGGEPFASAASAKRAYEDHCNGVRTTPEVEIRVLK